VVDRNDLAVPLDERARRDGRRAVGCYSPALRSALIAAALRAGVALREGILLGSAGPSYETAAEVRMAAALDADVACMSTVHEVTLAVELACEAASISCVTNRATGLSEKPLTHADVTEVADRAAHRLRAVMAEYLAARGVGAAR